ncbi:hypothetical protein GGI03_007346, partial [Coemansia sp. RSA 2337]
MESEQLECLLSTIENVLENQRGFLTRLEAAEQAIKVQSDRSTGHSRVTNDHESSDDDIHLDSESNDDEDDDVVESLENRPTLRSLRRQHIRRPSGLAPQPTTAAGRRETSNAFNQASTMAACGAELLRVALSSPQVDRRLARQAGDVFVVLKDMLASLHDRHADCLSQVTGDSVNVRRARETEEELEPRPEGATLAVRPSTRWWGRRVSGSGANVRNHPYLTCNSRPESPQRNRPQQPRNSYSPGTERVNESTTDAGLAVHVPSVVGSRDPSICVEVASPANTVLATVSGSDSTAEESADSVRDVSMADSSMVTIVEPDPVLDKRPTTVPGREDIIRDALLRQGHSESDVAAYFNGKSKGTNA